MLFSWKTWPLAALALLAFWPSTRSAWADDNCASCGRCQMFNCPHHTHCVEGGPRICFKCGCGLPIANPCNQPNWGYYQTCWSPWPWGPDWSHCPVQPPASLVWPPGPPGMMAPNQLPSRATPPGMLPSPIPVD